MMNDDDRFVDGLVRQYLKRQQETVNAEGVVEEVMKRRRRVLRFPGGRRGLIGVAAALLLLVGLLSGYLPHKEDQRQAKPKSLALTPLEDAVRTEAHAVWGALTTVSGAAFEAGREPVAELASAGPQLYSFPDDAREKLYSLPDSARRWFDRSMSMVPIDSSPRNNLEEEE